ncbi:hypothetical protein ACE193_21735 [Bernardetia sp. OM2101]|uniref:hypothetical protein n=1 Tax=Bernardetia sp. OM2101 TaxID=3344876 RepID=UPI0035D0DDAF
MESKNQKPTRTLSKSEFKEEMKVYLKEKLSTKEKGIKFLQELGVLTESGKLTKNYGGNG